MFVPHEFVEPLDAAEIVGGEMEILLWGLAGDSPLAAVRNELARMERTAILIDQRAVLETSIELHAGEDVACTVEWNGLRANLKKVTAAYLRPYDRSARCPRGCQRRQGQRCSASCDCRVRNAESNCLA